MQSPTCSHPVLLRLLTFSSFIFQALFIVSFFGLHRDNNMYKRFYILMTSFILLRTLLHYASNKSSTGKQLDMEREL